MDKKCLKPANFAGYTLIDVGNSLAFSVIGSYLSRFYTNILKIGRWASVILIVARIWDGINDPMMGFIAQRAKPTKNGKYRPWLIRGGIPLAFAAFLVFLKIPGLGTTGNVIWAFCTYIAYGMLYTIVLVPYGSLSSVMTYDEGERNLLSVCRSLGGGIGNVPGGILIPALCFVNNEIDTTRLSTVMAVFAVLMAVMYLSGYALIKENVPIPPEKQEINIVKTLKELIRDPVFVIMSLIGCLLIASNMYTGTVTTYLFPDYFKKSGMMIVYYICSYCPMVLVMPFVNKITKKFGKKEFITAGLILSTVASFILFIIHTQSIIVYCILNFIINLGVAFLTLEIWSLAVDIIDRQEYISGERREATTYSSFTFMRKIGQALAGIAPTLLLKIGYDTSAVSSGMQSVEVLRGMYNVSTAVPFVLYALMLALIIFYPLNKCKTEEMHKALDERRAAERVAK